MSGKLVLVTGANGFLGHHIVSQLAEKGYRVRGTIRSAKLQGFSEKVKIPGVEFVAIDDVATSDFTEAFKGVDAIIHTASPLPGAATGEVTVKTAVEGGLNVLRQAEKANISKIVFTGTFGNTLDATLRKVSSGETFTEADWSTPTQEEINANITDVNHTYFGSKAIGERAAWDYVKEHPSIDLCTVLPAFFYGPYAPNHPNPLAPGKMGTNGWCYMLSRGMVPPSVPPFFADVRDVAKVHVAALDLPRQAPEEKRFLVASTNFTWKEGAEHLKKVRPTTTRFADLDKLPAPPGLATLDTSRAKKVFKIEFITPEKTLEDLVDTLPSIEKSFTTSA